MIPVPGLEHVRCAWVDIQTQGFTLHGFLTFLGSDHYFPEYLDGEGLSDLNVWSGHDCAIFVVQSPSAAWIEYAKATNHTWWKLFGHLCEEEGEVGELLSAHSNTAVLTINGTTRTLNEVFAPCLNHFQHNDEIAKILHRFGLSPTDHPSLILFKDFRDRTVWYVDLKDLVNIPECDLRIGLKRWFSGADLKGLLKEASRA